MAAQAKRRAGQVGIYLKPIPEQEKLALAKWLLLGVAIMFTLGGVAYLVNDGPRGEKIFEACVTVLPPIATLVIGYYFSQARR
jgi:hypothetical protein